MSCNYINSITPKVCYVDGKTIVISWYHIFRYKFVMLVEWCIVVVTFFIWYWLRVQSYNYDVTLLLPKSKNVGWNMY